MSVNPSSTLNPTTAWVVGFINLPAAGQDAVTDCVSKYSAKNPEVSGKVQQLLYRVLEKLKSLFGASDWQKAHQALCKKSIVFKPVCEWCMGDRGFERVNEFALRCLVNNNKGSGKLILGAHRLLPKVNVDQVADGALLLAKSAIPQPLKGVNSLETLAGRCLEHAAKAALIKASELALGSLLFL